MLRKYHRKTSSLPNLPTKKLLDRLSIESGVDKIGPLGHYYEISQFDDAKELTLLAESLLECRIVKIRIYHNTNYIFGVQLTYKNLNSGRLFETEDGAGSNLKGYTDYILAEGEYIVNVEARIGAIIDKLTIRTNKERVFSHGGEGGGFYRYYFNGRVAVGTCGNSEGGWNGCMRQIVDIL